MPSAAAARPRLGSGLRIAALSALRVGAGTPLRRAARRVRRRMLDQAADCKAVQARTLQRLLMLGKGSQWQAGHGVRPGLSARHLAETVGITRYDDYAAAIDQMLAGNHRAMLGASQKVVMHALSSGTTGRTKHIPVSREFLTDYRRGWQAWGIGTFDTHRRLHTHNIFQMASSHNRGSTPNGVPCGNISGLVQTMQSPVVRTMYSVPVAALDVGDPQAKSYVALRAGLADPRVAMAMAANPSTLLQLAELALTRSDDLIRDLHDGTLAVDVPQALHRRLARRHRARAKELDRLAEAYGELTPRLFWPKLSVLACWTGGSCAAYLPRLRRLYRDAEDRAIPIRDHGLSASEGRMTIPLEDETASGLLDTQSHFFEFVPEDAIDQTDPPTRLAHELEVGQTYFILLTTSSGLVRYDIHDVVRCTGFVGTTPLLEFLHKGAHIANITGEKITESQVVHAVAAGCGASVFTVAPDWDATDTDAIPRYMLLLEPPAEVSLDRIDSALRLANEEYDDKRASGRLGRLGMRELPAGTFAALARQRQSSVGGSAEQYKHPFLLPQLDAIDSLLALETDPVAV